MVLPVTERERDEESAEDRAEVPVVANPESAQVAIWDVPQLMVVLLPLSTRLGLTIRLLIEPATTQVEPPCTCTWPPGHAQLGE